MLFASFSSPPNALPASTRSGSESSAMGDEGETPFEASSHRAAFASSDWEMRRERERERISEQEKIVEIGSPTKRTIESESSNTDKEGGQHTSHQKFNFLSSATGASGRDSLGGGESHNPSPNSSNNSNKIKRMRTAAATAATASTATANKYVPRTRTPNRATGRISVFMKRRLQKTGSLKAGSTPSRNAPIMASKAPRVLPKLRPDNTYDAFTSKEENQDSSPIASGEGGETSTGEEKRDGEESQSGRNDIDCDDGQSTENNTTEELVVDDIDDEDGTPGLSTADADADNDDNNEENEDDEYLDRIQGLSATNSLDNIRVEESESGANLPVDDYYDTLKSTKTRTKSADGVGEGLPSGAPPHSLATLADSPTSSTSSVTTTSSATAPVGGGANAGSGSGRIKMISATATWCPEKPLTLEMLKRMNEDQKQWSPDSEMTGGGKKSQSQLPEIPALSRTARNSAAAAAASAGESDGARRTITTAIGGGSR